jgi:hypothetical protein
MGNFIKDIQKTISFWLLILDEVWSLLWNDMRAMTITLASFALLAWIATCLFLFGNLPAEFADTAWSQLWLGVATSCTFTLVLLLLGFGLLLFVPAKIYERQGGFTEAPFEIQAKPPYKKQSDQPRWASVDVINTTFHPIDKCYVAVESVIDSTGKKIVGSNKFKWSNIYGKENRVRELELHGTPRTCDIAATMVEIDHILFETWSGTFLGGKGVYNITMVVHGLYNGFLKYKKFNLIMEYRGGNLINILKEGQEPWKDEELDPKPEITVIVKEAPKTKKRKSTLKKSSSKSSRK